MTNIPENLLRLRDHVEQCALNAGRKPEEITIVAVSKMKPREDVEAAIKAGQLHFGENKIQEAERKYSGPLPGASLHMIGHLQSNKTRQAAALFDRIHSLDKEKTIRRLNQHLAEAGRQMKAMIQVDIAGEQQKSGCSPADIPRLITVFSECGNLELDGLMIIPPYEQDAEVTRTWFRKLRELRDHLEQAHSGLALPELSMGMSGDYPVAIEEGATMIRVGTAIFGERDYSGKQ